jgi:dipeptidyl aminopeptidase/acylaminoacyl peptidase
MDRCRARYSHVQKFSTSFGGTIMEMKRSDETTQNHGLVIGRRKLLQLSGASLAAMGVASTSPLIAKAQDLSNGANNFYISDKVTMRKVSFKSQFEENVVGNLFTPKTLDRNTKAPAIVVGHPMGAVKEQSSNLYATMMAERGFVTLAIDLPFWGESAGQPGTSYRQMYMPKDSAPPWIISVARISLTVTASAPSASAAAAVS